MIDIELARIYGRIGAYELHARRSSRDTTLKARQAAFRRFEDKVDPGRELDEDERLKRARAAQRAELIRMSLRSRELRLAKKASVLR